MDLLKLLHKCKQFKVVSYYPHKGIIKNSRNYLLCIKFSELRGILNVMKHLLY